MRARIQEGEAKLPLLHGNSTPRLAGPRRAPGHQHDVALLRPCILCDLDALTTQGFGENRSQVFARSVGDHHADPVRQHGDRPRDHRHRALLFSNLRFRLLHNRRLGSGVAAACQQRAADHQHR